MLRHEVTIADVKVEMEASSYRKYTTDTNLQAWLNHFLRLMKDRAADLNMDLASAGISLILIHSLADGNYITMDFEDRFEREDIDELTDYLSRQQMITDIITNAFTGFKIRVNGFETTVFDWSDK